MVFTHGKLSFACPSFQNPKLNQRPNSTDVPISWKLRSNTSNKVKCETLGLFGDSRSQMWEDCESVPLPAMHNYPSSIKQASLWSRQLARITTQVCCLEGHWVVVSPPIFPEISLSLYSTRHRWRIWSPWDFVWRWAPVLSSPGIQQDYIVIISISILCDSLFHVRD